MTLVENKLGIKGRQNFAKRKDFTVKNVNKLLSNANKIYLFDTPLKIKKIRRQLYLIGNHE